MKKNLLIIGVVTVLVVILCVLTFFVFKNEAKYGKMQNGYKVYSYEKETQVYIANPNSGLSRTIRDTNKDGTPDIVSIGAGKMGESSASLTTQDSIDWAKAFQK